MTKEEADFKQRSKVVWLKFEDKNNRFFSIAAKLRKSKNPTFKIFNKDRNQTSKALLEDNSVRYFKKNI